MSVFLGWLVVLAIGGFVAWTLGRQRGARQRREDEEHALKHLFNQRDLGVAASHASLALALRRRDRSLRAVVQRLERAGLVDARGETVSLTADGDRRARQIVRAHRLWERYLADEAGVPLRNIHQAAESREHHLTPAEVERLDARLGHPLMDPHGDPIPDLEGPLERGADTVLTRWPAGVPARIVHIEDEPPSVYRQAEAAGLTVGGTVTILAAEPDAIELRAGDDDARRIAPAVAANVFVIAATETPTRPASAVRLSTLPMGKAAEVVALDDSCRGYTRRRLLDLGFTPGTRLVPALDTFAGDPRAYRVRGTTIALRRDQAAHVLVREVA